MSVYNDREFHFPREESDTAMPAEEAMPREEEFPREEPASFDEYNENAPKAFADHEEAIAKRRSRLKNYFIKPVAALIAATSLVWASYNYDPLGAGTSLSPVTPLIPTVPTTVTLAPDPNADSAFPTLPNLAPDDGTHITGGACQIYLYLADQMTNTVTFFASSTVQEQIGEYAGFVNAGWTVAKSDRTSDGSAVYDSATNTLTLNNYDEPYAQINANMMGNGFKIRLEGRNRVGQIIVWGWGYGGSLTLTGSGSLTVNPYYDNAVGIHLKAENNVPAGAGDGAPTESNCTNCLMVDGTVSLVEAFGTQAAFALDGHSKAEKGLYYLHPLHLYGGDPGFWYNDQGQSLGVYTVFDEKGELATHILFSPELPGLEHANDPADYPSRSTYAPNESVTVTVWSNDDPSAQMPASLADGAQVTNANYRGLGVAKTYRNGVQNDHYLVLDGTALVRGSACASDIPAVGTVKGAAYEYDAEMRMSTLTLTNFKGGVLKARLMGTLVIEVVGECELDGIEILGYFSSSWISVQGGGKLTVNADRKNSKGILLDAQYGWIRMYVEGGVTLDVYGGRGVSSGIGDDINAAILVKACSGTDPIVYFPETEMTGGTRKLGAFEYDYDLVPTTPTSDTIDATSFFRDATVVDENGDPSPHVTFAPAN